MKTFHWLKWQAKKQLIAKTPVRSVGGTLDGYGVFELTRPSITTPPIFAVQTKQKPLHHLNEVEDNRHIYSPYRKVPWRLATEPTEYSDLQVIWKEARQCIYEHLDLSEDHEYDVLTAWTFATWLLEKWQSVPYLFFFGAYETGKTRALEILSRLSSRGWLALYITPANLYRPLQDWKPTLFLDEAEVYGDMKDILALLNGSYRRGQLVPRQVEAGKSYETEFFDCFGFKAIAGTKKLAQTLASRCIVFRMTKATRKVKLFIDEKQCDALRNKLLKWRFDALLSEGSERSEAFPDAEALAEEIGSGRLTELFYPLINLTPTNELKEQLKQTAKEIAQERIEELSLSTEAVVLSAILKAKQDGRIDKGRIFIQNIAEIINEQRPVREQWTNRFVSSICSRLGFKRVRTGSGGKSALVWNQQLIDRLKKDSRYQTCFTPPTSSEPSERSENWLVDRAYSKLN